MSTIATLSNRAASPDRATPSDRKARLDDLRRRIRRIERDLGRSGCLGGTVAAGAAEEASACEEESAFDRLLGGGVGLESALHELTAGGYPDQPAVRDFALALIAAQMRQGDDDAMVLWCQRQRDALEFGRLYGPGLKALGLAPERFLMVTGRKDADCLWAMEQGLASRSLLAVVGQVDRAGLTASRRLSLAASAHGAACLLLPAHHGREPSAARTRWRIQAVPSFPDHLDPKGLGRPCWRLALERSPNGQTGQWTVEWDHATHHFHLAPPMAHQPAATCSSGNVARRNGRDKENGAVIALERTG